MSKCHDLPRRRFLQTSGGLLAGAVGVNLLRADERPTVTQPRATAADVVEPDWRQRVTVQVGNDRGDLVGNDHRVIQTAIDYVARLGGGTVQVLPGTYRLRNAVNLQSRIRIVGSGTDCVLFKEASVSSKLHMDADPWDQEITLADPAGFQVGDGVSLVCRDPHNGRRLAMRRTLVARSGDRFKLDRALREHYWLAGNPRAATLFPHVNCSNVSDVTIENLVLDGNRANNELLDPGDWDGCVSLDDCNRVTIRKVTACRQSGDGIIWAYSHDVVVEDCHCYDNLYFGMHAGLGSQRPLVRGNRMQGNEIGFYFCFGVKYGLLDKNVIEDSRTHGIHVGHADTDNLIRDNDIRRSGLAGVTFVGQGHKPFDPHRNVMEHNRISDSGSENGVAIDIQGETESITVTQNQLRESRKPLNRVGIQIGPQTSDVRLMSNEIEGFAVTVNDLRTSGAAADAHR